VDFILLNIFISELQMFRKFQHPKLETQLVDLQKDKKLYPMEGNAM